MKIILNPNKEVVSTIREGLKQTGGHCPCIIEDYWNQDTMCPCKEFRVTKDCLCSLYVSA